MPRISLTQLLIDDTREIIDSEPQLITLASIENMLGMSSTVDIANNIKSYIMEIINYEHINRIKQNTGK